MNRLCASYSEAEFGIPFVIWGSSGLLEISCRQASAAQVLHVEPNEEFELRAETNIGSS